MAPVNSLFQGFETKRTDERKRIACNSSLYKSQSHTKERKKKNRDREQTLRPGK